MARYGRLLTNAHGRKFVPCGRNDLNAHRGGRPPSNDRKVLEGILWNSAQWRSLAGFARRVPLTSNVLAATSRLGTAGCLAHHLARIPGGTEPTRATELERVVSGRQFRSGQKRGSKVGKTNRGKGTKWMGVVDGQGVPLGKQLYSASPNKVRLAEETLTSIRVTRRHRGGTATSETIACDC